MWARLGLLLLGIGVLVFASIALIAKVARPYREVGAQGGQLSTVRRQIAELDAQNAVLHRRIVYLKTADGVASEARKMGYLRPGEVPLVIIGGAPSLPTSSAPAVPEAAPVASRGSNAAQRFWRHLTGR
ncbi:MAG: septum formation initiator family protein [Armatimonadota bacterium]|nr:septum formation initiator family protein [Armatimonadota bacterium]